MKPAMIVAAGLIVWGYGLFAQTPPTEPPAQPGPVRLSIACAKASPRAANARGRMGEPDDADASTARSNPAEILAELRALPQARLDDVAAIQRLAAKIEKNPAIAGANGAAVRYYTGMAHRLHGLLPIGFVDQNADPCQPLPYGRFYWEYHVDAQERLLAIVAHTDKGKRYLTNRLVYEGNDVIAHLSFSPKGFEFGDYGAWHEGKLRTTGRVLADGGMASCECIFWIGDREDYTARFAGWNRTDPDKIPLQSLDFGTVRIELKPTGEVERVWRYSSPARQP